MSRYRVTVDTGGTFSDFVYLDEESGEVSISKVPSTPDDPSRAILQGIEMLLTRGVRAADIAFFCHGTTVGTNVIVQKRGAKVGLITTKGHNDVIHIMRGSRGLQGRDVADAVLFLASPMSDMVQGQTLVVDGGSCIHG